MRVSLSTALAAASFFGASVAQDASATSSGPLTEYTLQADSITAKFIPYGARLTSLTVPDRDGKEQDVVVGYDSPEDYVRDTETNHTYFGKAQRHHLTFYTNLLTYSQDPSSAALPTASATAPSSSTARTTASPKTTTKASTPSMAATSATMPATGPS